MNQKWDGKERREGMERFEQMQKDIGEMRTDLALLINKVDANHVSLRNTIERNHALTEKHEHTLYGNGAPGLTAVRPEIKNVKKDLDTHVNIDRWMFGVLTTILLAIVAKLMAG